MKPNISVLEFLGEDGICYDVSLNFGSDYRLRIHYDGFSEKPDEILTIEDTKAFHELCKRFQLPMRRLEDKECNILKSKKVVFVKREEEDEEFICFKARIHQIIRKRHIVVDGRDNCMCKFSIEWLDGPNMGKRAIVHCENIYLQESGSIMEHPVLKKIQGLLQSRGKEGLHDTTSKSFLSTKDVFEGDCNTDNKGTSQRKKQKFNHEGVETVPAKRKPKVSNESAFNLQGLRSCLGDHEASEKDKPEGNHSGDVGPDIRKQHSHGNLERIGVCQLIRKDDQEMSKSDFDDANMQKTDSRTKTLTTENKKKRVASMFTTAGVKKTDNLTNLQCRQEPFLLLSPKKEENDIKISNRKKILGCNSGGTILSHEFHKSYAVGTMKGKSPDGCEFTRRNTKSNQNHDLDVKSSVSDGESGEGIDHIHMCDNQFPLSNIILVENLEKNVTIADLLGVIRPLVTGFVKVYISPSYEYESSTRGYICFKKHESFRKVLEFLQDESKHIVSFNCRPWVASKGIEQLSENVCEAFTPTNDVFEGACEGLWKKKIQMFIRDPRNMP